MTGHQPRRPCVVVILSDDHGYADRSSLGIHPEVRTPALDELAADGVTCTQAYVTAPICSPSRAAIMSGHHQRRWGSRWFGDSHYPEHLPSIAEHLRADGYHTAYLGKVHYGPEEAGDPGTPEQHGFETTFYGLAGNQFGRLNYLRHSEAAVEEYGEFASTVSAVQPMIENGEPVELEGFLTEEIGTRACDYIADHADEEEPFFLFVAFNAVHNFCWQLPSDELERRGLPPVEDFTGDASEYDDWYGERIDPDSPHGRDYYLAQLELMDAQIARIQQQLTDSGLADDTMLVYLTDNGGGHCNFASNAPLRGGKYSLWEGGVRVPFLVRWPAGGVKGGAEMSQLVSSVDIMPTVLSAAGSSRAADSTPDGVNLLPLLTASREGGSDDCSAVTSDGADDRTLHWDTGHQWAVRSGSWKLAWTQPWAPEEGGRGLDLVNADLGEEWRLHDLSRDPGEQVNLVDDEMGVAARLRAERETWLARVTSP